MRIFDRYRVDDKNVLPLYDENNMVGDDNLKSDPLNGLELLLRQEILPRVIFIEPRFSDVPPLKIANDDLAPADLRLGQAFVGAIYDKLSKSPRWKDLSLLITYDEHGGFFDHVPPPGTTESSITDIPKIHPDGPSFLGVRVPTMLISPLVSEQSVCKYQFDHTSILKTILVHNRMQLPNAELISFGDRVNQAEHLGVAFNLDTPRVAPLFTGQTGFDITTMPSNKTTFYGNSNADNVSEKKALQTDYHESLKKLFLP